MTDETREALKHAYIKGATDVHNYWTENPGEAPRGDPEFGEAGSDYAASAIDLFDSAAPGPAHRLAHTVPGDAYRQIGFVSWKEGEHIEIWNPESFHDYDITDDDRANGYTSSPIYIKDDALSTSPVIDTNAARAALDQGSKA